MKKLILASISAVALFGVAACSDSTDATQTNSIPDPAATETAPVTPTDDTMAPAVVEPVEPASPPAN